LPKKQASEKNEIAVALAIPKLILEPSQSRKVNTAQQEKQSCHTISIKSYMAEKGYSGQKLSYLLGFKYDVWLRIAWTLRY
jgi:hypothetical protein